MTLSYEIHAIDSEALRELRSRDDAGRPPRLLVDESGGNPLRCCLGRSVPGEPLALVSYAPLRRWAARTGASPGPYDEVGPVFVHVNDCGGYAGGLFPEGVRGARRVLRAYAADGRILRGQYVEADPAGTDIEAELDLLYADPQVAAVHVRAVEFGCFLMETARVEVAAT
jgi:hypothetical protein